jgi:putative oxidoreductase
MDKLTIFIGRVIYAIPFLGFGLGHLFNGGQMGGMVPSFIPGGVFWIYFTGVAMVLAALAIITGKQGRAACFGLVVMLLVFIVTMHLPGLANPQMKMMAMMSLFKDMGLMGGALVIAGTFKK